jgi:hypothetical protein
MNWLEIVGVFALVWWGFGLASYFVHLAVMILEDGKIDDDHYFSLVICLGAGLLMPIVSIALWIVNAKRKRNHPRP